MGRRKPDPDGYRGTAGREGCPQSPARELAPQALAIRPYIHPSFFEGLRQPTRRVITKGLERQPWRPAVPAPPPTRQTCLMPPSSPACHWPCLSECLAASCSPKFPTHTSPWPPSDPLLPCQFGPSMPQGICSGLWPSHIPSSHLSPDTDLGACSQNPCTWLHCWKSLLLVPRAFLIQPTGSSFYTGL